MPLSEFRKKKLLYVFNTFFDVDKSGDITKKDIDLAVNRICESRGWSAKDLKATQTRETLLRVWDGLQQRADENGDGQINSDEWIAMWDQYAANPNQAQDWQQTYMNFIFDLEDFSGDGSVNESEFQQVWKCYGVPEDEAGAAFQKLRIGAEITRDKFGALWKEYFSSDDPEAPGNFIFGKLSF